MGLTDEDRRNINTYIKNSRRESILLFDGVVVPSSLRTEDELEKARNAVIEANLTEKVVDAAGNDLFLFSDPNHFKSLQFTYPFVKEDDELLVVIGGGYNIRFESNNLFTRQIQYRAVKAWADVARNCYGVTACDHELYDNYDAFFEYTTDYGEGNIIQFNIMMYRMLVRNNLLFIRHNGDNRLRYYQQYQPFKDAVESTLKKEEVEYTLKERIGRGLNHINIKNFLLD